ncbi:MAG: hypothetical protein WB495_20830 [Xanthobacteraceae bacterium]
MLLATALSALAALLTTLAGLVSLVLLTATTTLVTLTALLATLLVVLIAHESLHCCAKSTLRRSTKAGFRTFQKSWAEKRCTLPLFNWASLCGAATASRYVV